MISLSEIKAITFRKANLGGYKTDDVDKFIDSVIETCASLTEEKEKLNEQLARKEKIVQDYLNNEKNIGAALMNAQSQSETILRDADQKAAIIIGDATKKSEEMINKAKEDVDKQYQELLKMQEEIASFKNTLLNVYQKHLEYINVLPTQIVSTNDEQEQNIESLECEQIDDIAKDNTGFVVDIKAESNDTFFTADNSAKEDIL